MRLGHALTCTLLCLTLVLTGCALQQTAPLAPEPGVKFTGSVHGGQQPIVGAHIYLFAANTTGYGQPSVSLLNPATTGLSDSIGAYVTTDSTGSFTITGDYSCTPNTQVYLYSLGGDPGAGVNAAASLLAALGNCPSSGSFLASIPFINVNEVTTIAAAYAMAGFATDATHVSSSGTTLAQTGIANAFANTANLATIASGAALATTPAGNGAVPQATINTLANILASCVNSTGPSSVTCSTLFSNAESSGSTGITPTDTATAAINIAHNPGANIASLYALATPTPPFAPALGSVPNDFNIAINFIGGSLYTTTGVAIDAVGNVWVSNNRGSRITELAAGTGASLSGYLGFFGGGLNQPNDIAIDTSGNVWSPNGGNASLTELNGTNGNTISGANGYTGGGLYSPQRIAIDGAGNAWVTGGGRYISKFNGLTGAAISPPIGYTGGGLSDGLGIAIDTSGSAWIANYSSIVKLNSDGSIASGSTGYTGGGLDFAARIAIDAFGNAWTSNVSNNSVSKFSSNGVAISPSAGYTGGGLSGPGGIAIDGVGNVWVPNQNNNSVTCLNGSTGAAISPSTGYIGNGLRVPDGVAIDGSGNLWVINFGNLNLTEFVGVAAPVVTPLSAGAQNHTLGTRP
jgi:hypothetical protein